MSLLYGECRRRSLILFRHVAAIFYQRSLRLLSSQELNLAKEAEIYVVCVWTSRIVEWEPSDWDSGWRKKIVCEVADSSRFICQFRRCFRARRTVSWWIKILQLVRLCIANLQSIWNLTRMLDQLCAVTNTKGQAEDDHLIKRQRMQGYPPNCSWGSKSVSQDNGTICIWPKELRSSVANIVATHSHNAMLQEKQLQQNGIT